jgi:transposase
VDDWALHRGQRYGTILIDLERRRVLDLLPDRTAERFSQWLKTHPEVQIVSRDRGGNYALGARAGAPQATQVADRFHLLKNLTEMLERLLIRQYRSLREVARQIAVSTASPSVAETAVDKEAPRVARPPTRAQQGSQHRRERRLARYEPVVVLHQEGIGLRQIARRLKLARNTVKKWLAAGCFREQTKRSVRCSKLAPFVDYLQQRGQEGCHNARHLCAEINEQGYGGSVNLVERLVNPWRNKQHGTPSRPREAPPSARCVLWWLLGHYSKTDPEARERQRAFIQQLCEFCPEIGVAQELAVRFQQMVKARRRAELDPWLDEAACSGLAELQGFAQGLRQDYEAVRRALSSAYNHGQTAGQVNRLKMLKRQMYGRANLDLLRARVLPMAQAA